MLAVHPDSFHYHALAAVAASNLGMEDEFWPHFAFAIARMPTDDPNLIRLHLTGATTRLRRGDFTAFGEIVRWVDRLPNREGRLALESPEWDGGDLSGRTILVGATQDGDGDTIMFCRYLPLLKARGARVKVVCWERLASLLAGIDAVDQVIIPETAVPADAARHDLHVYWLPLPSLFGTTLETIPADVPYLVPDPGQFERWRAPITTIPACRVGISWQGNPKNNLDRLRSLPLAELAPLAKVSGLSLISLQKGFGSEQLADVGFPVWDLGPDYHAGDWLTTAAIVSQLDLIISSDTAIAHLAARWAAPCGWRWAALRTGGGSRIAMTRPGIPRCGCSARTDSGSGDRSSVAWRRRWRPGSAESSRARCRAPSRPWPPPCTGRSSKSVRTAISSWSSRGGGSGIGEVVWVESRGEGDRSLGAPSQERSRDRDMAHEPPGHNRIANHLGFGPVEDTQEKARRLRKDRIRFYVKDLAP